MKSKVKGDINNKCKIMTWGALEIKKGRKIRILEVLEPHSSANPHALARSQDNERKNLEPGHTRAWLTALQCAQVSEKNKNGASIPKSLALSLLSLLSRAPSIILPRISYREYFYHLIPPFVLTHSLSVMLLAFLPIDFPVWASKGSYEKS